MVGVYGWGILGKGMGLGLEKIKGIVPLYIYMININSIPLSIPLIHNGKNINIENIQYKYTPNY